MGPTQPGQASAKPSPPSPPSLPNALSFPPDLPGIHLAETPAPAIVPLKQDHAPIHRIIRRTSDTFLSHLSPSLSTVHQRSRNIHLSLHFFSITKEKRIIDICHRSLSKKPRHQSNTRYRRLGIGITIRNTEQVEARDWK